MLRKGCHVVFATAGKLLRLLEDEIRFQGILELTLERLRIVVLEDADAMIKKDWDSQLDRLSKYLPKDVYKWYIAGPLNENAWAKLNKSIDGPMLKFSYKSITCPYLHITQHFATLLGGPLYRLRAIDQKIPEAKGGTVLILTKSKRNVEVLAHGLDKLQKYRLDFVHGDDGQKRGKESINAFEVEEITVPVSVVELTDHCTFSIISRYLYSTRSPIVWWSTMSTSFTHLFILHINPGTSTFESHGVGIYPTAGCSRSEFFEDGSRVYSS